MQRAYDEFLEIRPDPHFYGGGSVDEVDDDEDDDDIPDLDYHAYVDTSSNFERYAREADIVNHSDEAWETDEDEEPSSAVFAPPTASASTQTNAVAILKQISGDGSSLSRNLSEAQCASVDAFLGRLLTHKEKLKHLKLVRFHYDANLVGLTQSLTGSLSKGTPPASGPCRNSEMHKPAGFRLCRRMGQTVGRPRRASRPSGGRDGVSLRYREDFRMGHRLGHRLISPLDCILLVMESANLPMTMTVLVATPDEAAYPLKASCG
jgi:hypothetical protein